MRCFELEKLQFNTEKTEDGRYSKTRQYIRQKSASSGLSKARVQSAKSARPNSSKCAPDCTQSVCVGNCIGKSLACLRCNKKSCDGTCATAPYTIHSRLTDDGMGQTKHRLPRPKSCGPCSKETNPAKKVNQQQTELGRPRSSHCTYSQAKKSVRQAMDLRASTQQLSVDQIPLDNSHNHRRPVTAPVRLKNCRYWKGRESVAPHKSYNSQRRISLTTNSVRPVFGGKLSSKGRVGSSKSSKDKI